MRIQIDQLAPLNLRRYFCEEVNAIAMMEPYVFVACKTARTAKVKTFLDLDTVNFVKPAPEGPTQRISGTGAGFHQGTNASERPNCAKIETSQTSHCSGVPIE
jgi:hypothetical protein